ncbi:Brp/Blh family beta-carotene 15,15'-dioxygenase [Marivirga arenosa]|uniref:Brp/Blh family beta-carotene 15,15'-dioxygenase n=1 Tax=Marivirga arenosa TaxID=3059076 RepID=A0AA49GIE5_9BACT|nr:Brp/Blh family beta-carotene 15,15'-dioxygenase [Marivirga sp. ABR2-2]WKK86425.2 Brp/Blh family beta-carotene 15,15'-dioxygenase [Marivirga sp. ABR2-2]
MTKAIFYFIAANLLFLPLLSISEGPFQNFAFYITVPFIIIFGIPHGAIDNVLFKRSKKISNFKFIAVYLSIIALNIGLWLVTPVFAYVLFLLISAYHFGQSEFTHYLKKQTFYHKILFFSWGLILIVGLIYFNLAEINLMTQKYESFASFELVHSKQMLEIIFVGSLAITLIILAQLVYKNIISIETVLMEIIVMSLTLLSFYLMPLLIGFSLYFIILHSYKVMEEEFKYLKSENIISNLKGFLKLLTPFSVLSFAGILFLFALIYFNIISLSYGYIMLIIISSITLPHVFVMDQFYNLLFKSGFFRNS